MKKTILFTASAVASLFLFSCQKEIPTPTKSTNAIQIDKDDFTFSENNSRTITWNQLPENLKNAENLEAPSTLPRASYILTVGPWGGGGGTPFYIYPTASTDKIYAIAVRSGMYVDALTVWYRRANGTIYSYSKGGSGGSFYIQYFAGDEYIRAMGGRSGLYLDRLSIYTNKKSFSYGGNGGAAFYVSAPSNGQILGFPGRSGRFIDQIGGYVYSF